MPKANSKIKIAKGKRQIQITKYQIPNSKIQIPKYQIPKFQTTNSIFS
jgi:hypothetical protein